MLSATAAFPPRPLRLAGMTLLELLLVIAILGFLAAMVIPFMGLRNNTHLETLTWERMELIRQAMIGDERAVDLTTRQRVIGGYIGDACSDPRDRSRCDWPSLWEPGGNDIGPAEDQLGADDRGRFDGKRFVWNDDDGFKQVVGDALKKQSLGQPRGLWTRDLDHDDSLDDIADTSSAPWLGPYLNPPITRNRAVGRHYAKDQDEYAGLVDFDRQQFHLLQGDDQLTDAWNQAFRFFIGPYSQTDDEETFWIVSHGPDGFATFPDDAIENYDKDAAYNEDNLILKIAERDWRELVARQTLRSTSTIRLIQLTEDRIARVVAALIGAAPAGENTGYTGDLLGWPDLYNWEQKITVTGEDENDDDNETLTIRYSVDGESREKVIDEIGGDDADAVAGKIATELGDDDDVDATADGAVVTVNGVDGKCIELNSATFAGTIATSNPIGPLAAAFSGEWGYPEPGDAGYPYTYGQPRGLWDKGSAGDLADTTAYGIGWRPGYSDEPYHAVPDGEAEFERLEDEWYQPLHFFKVDEGGEEQLLIVSGGPDGWVLMDDGSAQRRYGSCSGAWSVLHDLGDYSVSAEDNKDNIARLLRRRVWRDGYLHVETIAIGNASQTGTEVTKCKLFGGVLEADEDPPVRSDWLRVADVPAEDFTGTTWMIGKYVVDTSTGPSVVDATPAIQYPDSTDQLVTGARYLVCWNDEDTSPDPGFNVPDPGEKGWWRIFSLYGHPAKQVEHELILVDAADFTALPSP